MTQERAARQVVGIVVVTMLGLAACSSEDSAAADTVITTSDTHTAGPPQDAGDSGGELGEPCVLGRDCRSGVCAPGAQGRVCSKTCGECPAGYACLPVAEIGDVCVPDDVVLCQPCRDDAECVVPGAGSGGFCVSYGDEGAFCATGCRGDSDCAEGFSCTGDRCVADSGTCQCNGAGISLRRSTACALTNAHGSCPGVRSCTGSGLSRCDAAAARAEVCNGLDDDCDGESDEDVEGASCTLTNEFGTCQGALACTEGVPVCVGPAPAAEVCDGADNDCDGMTDEGADDFDGDGLADCVDPDIDGDGAENAFDCADFDLAIGPGRVDICNGVDDDCSGVADDGPHDCGSYVCLGAAGCRDHCDDDRHCVEGYRCDLFDHDGDEDRSECLPSVCGNAQVEAREVCDDGTNDGSYDGCNPDCGSLGPHCGDGRVRPGVEACDDGALNGTPNRCNAACTGQTPPKCGNGVLESEEQCDLGADANSDAANASCRSDCTARACGDGIVDDAFGEACDDGGANGNSICGCQVGCMWPPADTVCRAASGVCEMPALCNEDHLCPAVNPLFGAPGRPAKECRPRAGEAAQCDAPEFCDGESVQCPADFKYGDDEAGPRVCRPVLEGHLCDLAEECPGRAEAEAAGVDPDLCPEDAVKTRHDGPCRFPAGICDIPEYCPGPHFAVGDPRLCPPDEKWGGPSAGPGHQDLAVPLRERGDGERDNDPCRPAASTCDSPEYCGGTIDGWSPDSRLGDDCPEPDYFYQGTACSDAGCSGVECTCRPLDNQPADGAAGSLTAQETACQSPCGNGTLDDGEACDDGYMNGARDHCDLGCGGICGVQPAWLVQAGGPDVDVAWDVAVDQGGNAFTGGTFETPSSDESGTIGATGGLFGGASFESTAGSVDVFLASTNAEGEPQWAWCAGGALGDELVAVDVDARGDVYAVGRFVDHMYFGCCGGGGAGQCTEPGPQPPGGASAPSCPSATSADDDPVDLFLVKLDGEGRLRWFVTGAVAGAEDRPRDVAAYAGGESVVVGSFSVATEAAADADIAGGQGLPDLPSWGGRDIFVMKQDRHGGRSWAASAGGEADEEAFAVDVDGSGNIYVGGWFQQDFSWGGVSFTRSGNHEGPAGFVVKLAPEGEPEWGRVFEGQLGLEVTDLAVDGAGRVTLSGEFRGAAHFAGGTEPGDADDSADVFVVSLDAAGDERWHAVATGPGDDTSRAVEVDRAGNTWIAGGFSQRLSGGDFVLDTSLSGPSTDACPDGEPPLGAQSELAPGSAIFLAKLGPLGAWLWARQEGGETGNVAMGLALDTRGAATLAGYAVPPADVGELRVDGCPGQPGGQSFNAEAFATRMPPGGPPDCFECGDGVSDPGESCDPGPEAALCRDPEAAGSGCDGLCSGPANVCGDGWLECGETWETVDVPVADPDYALCRPDAPTGQVWCFQTAAEEFTLEPVMPGEAVRLGPGVAVIGASTIGGNPYQPDVCPEASAVDAHHLGTASSWTGTRAPLDSEFGREQCDGDPSTPICNSFDGDCPPSTNDRAAALECGHYFEFIADTGAAVAFEFDEIVAANGFGPTGWALYVGFGQDVSSYQLAFEDTTTSIPPRTSFLPDGVEGPMHSVDLTGLTFEAPVGLPGDHTPRPITDQSEVHFRLYAWGAASTDAPWNIDNVVVGPASVGGVEAGAVAAWPADYSALDVAVGGGSDGALVGDVGYGPGVACASFQLNNPAPANGPQLGGPAAPTEASRVTMGDPPALRLAGPLSVDLWVRADGPADGLLQLLAGRAGAEGWSYALALMGDDGGLYPVFAVTASGADDGDAVHAVGSEPIAAEVGFVHVAGVYDGAEVRLYADGRLQGRVPFAGPIHADPGVAFNIGAVGDPSAGTPYAGFSGNIDAVHVWDRALTKAEIEHLATSRRARGGGCDAARVDCAPPVAD